MPHYLHFLTNHSLLWEHAPMKTVLLLLLSLSAQAEPMGNPCAGHNCNAPMSSIAAEFMSASGIQQPELPYVASGECYHHTSMYNPDTVHYGYTLLDQNDGATYMGGTFAFFYSENPYAEYTVEKARELLPERFTDDHRLEMQPDYSFVDMNAVDPTVPWKYWLKQSGQNLLVIGQWGTKHRLFCRFQKNQ